MKAWWSKQAKLAVDRNIVYSRAGGEALRLDVFRPRTRKTLPGMVGIVGGGWRNCLRARFDSLSIVLASAGHVVASISYRIAPRHQWPACLQDAKTAVRWLRANAERYAVDPAHIGAMGSSAGGYLAAMLAVTGSENFGGAEHLDQPSGIQAAVALCAPADMFAIFDWHKEDGVATNFLGGTPQDKPDAYRAASPMTYVGSSCAPIFFIHGEADKTVPIDPVRQMSQRLRDSGVDSPMAALPGVGHGVRAYMDEPTDANPLPQVFDFMARHLGKA